MTSITRDEILALPKCDLHVHLDGSLRLSTILDLAEQQKVSLPAKDEEGLRKAMRIGQRCKDLNEYLEAFGITCSVLQTEEALERAAFEMIEDCHQENIRYVEVRFSPILHTDRKLPIEYVLEAVLRGLERGRETFGVESGVIICGIRNMNPNVSYRLAQLCVAYKHKGVVAFDLAGAEYNHPAKDHLRAFYLIVNNNINCTIHAGEAYGSQSIHEAIHYTNANRIGHGTRLFEDGELLNYVNDHRVPLEMCVSSNVQTGAVESFEDHPLPMYFRKGVRVTVNTDNRLITDTTVTDELLICHEKFNLNLFDLKLILMNGFKSAFQPYERRRKMLAKMRVEMGLQKFYSPTFGTTRIPLEPEGDNPIVD